MSRREIRLSVRDSGLITLDSSSALGSIVDMSLLIVTYLDLHHAMIDRTWTIWQAQDLQNRLQVIAVSLSNPNLTCKATF